MATTPPPASPGDQLEDAVTSNLVKLVTALGTTAGFVTLVAGTGGAILWARFSAAGLPANEALAIVPKSELIASGAATLALFILLGVLAVAGVFAIDNNGRASTALGIALGGIITVELLAVCWFLSQSGRAWFPPALVSLLPLGLAIALHLWSRPKLKARKALEAEEQERVDALNRIATAKWQNRGLWKRLTDYRAGTVAPSPSTPTPQHIGGTREWIGATIVVLLAVVGVFFGYAQSHSTPGFDWVAPSAVIAAAVLAGLCFAIAYRSGGRFLPLGVAVFFAVMLFGSVMSTAIAVKRPKLSPIALLRQTGEQLDGVLGFYVARTSDRYWLAAVANDCDNPDNEVAATGLSGRGRIFSVARDSVIDDEQGALLALVVSKDPSKPKSSIVDPNTQARLLMDEVLRRRPKGSLPANIKVGRHGVPGRYSRSLDPPLNSCPPPAGALGARIAVEREAGQPRMLLLNATASTGTISSYAWKIRDDGSTGKDIINTHPVFRYRVPPRSGAATVTLKVIAKGDKSATAKVRIRRQLSSTAWFRSGRATLTTDGKARLRRFARTLRSETVARVYVDGRADTDGSERSNLELSWRRVREVRAALLRVRPGLGHSHKLVLKGYGEQAPLTTNETAAGKLANRSVDMLVVGTVQAIRPRT